MAHWQRACAQQGAAMTDVRLWTRDEILSLGARGLLVVMEGDHVRAMEAQDKRIAELEALVRRLGGWICPECGPSALADEDGCCAGCGLVLEAEPGRCEHDGPCEANHCVCEDPEQCHGCHYYTHHHGAVKPCPDHPESVEDEIARAAVAAGFSEVIEHERPGEPEEEIPKCPVHGIRLWCPGGTGRPHFIDELPEDTGEPERLGTWVHPTSSWRCPSPCLTLQGASTLKCLHCGAKRPGHWHGIPGTGQARYCLDDCPEDDPTRIGAERPGEPAKPG